MPCLDVVGVELSSAFASQQVPAVDGRVVRIASDDDTVPRISHFYGIVIEMYFRDHPPPHFHARYGGEEAVIAIATGEIIAGSLPGRALRLVREWTRMHHDELDANWALARARQAPVAIAPLP